jgi:hypothetical protein
VSVPTGDQRIAWLEKYEARWTNGWDSRTKRITSRIRFYLNPSEAVFGEPAMYCEGDDLCEAIDEGMRMTGDLS